MNTVHRDIEKPPGGWKYTVPETGVTVKADFFSMLYKRVVAHREANRLPVPDDYYEFLEDAACAETNPGAGWCGQRKAKPSHKKPIQHMRLTRVESFLKTVWQAIIDRKFVEKDEAQRRVDICLKCPLRTTMPGGCTGCYSLVHKGQKLLQKNGAIEIEAYEDGFVRDVCGACGCIIPLKAALPNSTLNKAEGNKRPAYWEGCWRNEDEAEAPQ